MTPKRRMALLGGGPGSFIGRIHQLGAELAGIDLVAGVFSSDPDRSRAAAAQYGVAPDRCYPDAAALFAGEAVRDDGIELVTIATPNHLHLPAALAAIAAGIDVVSDKPPTATLAEALTLRDALAASDRLYALTFSYAAYPMVREARARVAAGAIGRVRKVVVSYLQGWLAAPLERAGNPRAGWRTDPARSGIGGALADLGTHAFHLAEYVAGIEVEAVLGNLAALVPGRALDDDGTVLLRLDGGATGTLLASQVAFGERNGLSLQIYGDAGAIGWRFEEADVLRLTRGGETTLLTPMSPGLLAPEPLPPGIGNGLVAPFAILYRDVAAALAGDRARVDGVLPGIGAGVRAMRFVERAVESSAAGGTWLPLGG